MSSILPLIKKTSLAAVQLRNTSDKQIQQALTMLADVVVAETGQLLNANKKDVAKQGDNNPKTDRLLLTEQRIAQIAASIKKVSVLPNPSGMVLQKKTLYNGLRLQKVTVSLGVVGAIYESRPNVTFDIASLCLRSTNGCILKGSSDAFFTNKAAVSIIKKVLVKNGIDPDCVTLLPPEREVVQELFTATRYVDVIIPRGSDSLIQYVRKNSLVPVIETGAGVCHVYVHAEADIKKALKIVVNAKVSRPSVCNAMDTLLVDAAVAATFLQQLQPLFAQHGVAVYAEKKAYPLLKDYALLEKATEQDFSREYLSLACAVKVVKNIDEALKHISQFSTRHSEAIVSGNKAVCDRFVREVDAAVVYTNASTRFTDGEEFGLGAEIGISTQKLHARGPFALEKLVTEKWIIKGNGQVR